MSLKVILLLFVPVGFGFAWIVPLLQPVPPIEWKRYSKLETTRLLTEGNTVLLFIFASYCPMENHPSLRPLSSQSLRRAFSEDQFIPMKLVYDDWNSEELREVTELAGYEKEPYVVVFRPNESVEKWTMAESESQLLDSVPVHREKYNGACFIVSLAAWVIVAGREWLRRGRRKDSQGSGLDLTK